MTGHGFIRKVKRLGRARGVEVWLDAERGKGSHAILYYGDRRTVVRYRRKELGKGLLHAMCRQLGIRPDDL